MDNQATPLLPPSEARPYPATSWPAGAVDINDLYACGGCGRAAEIEWRFTPLDADERYLEGVVRVCRGCMRATMQVLESRLPDLGAVPLRGRR